MQKSSAIYMAVLLAFGGASSVEAAWYSTTGNNLTILGGTGLLTGGTNDVIFGWDGTARTAVVIDGSSNASLSSPTPYFGKLWTAHHMNVYGAGTYVFDTTCLSGNPSCGTGTDAQKYTLIVPDGYLGAHLLLDWSTTFNTDIVLLWKRNAPFGGPICAQPSTTGDCSTNPNPNGNNISTIWSLASVDTDIDADLYPGTKMIDGPFVGKSWNFNVMTAPVPLPSAAWLLGTGLLGMIGVAKRRKSL